MTTSHFNNLTEAELERLSILIEECAEVQQIACKVLRHGYPSVNPLIPETTSNRQYLEIELGHLMNALDLLLNHGDVHLSRVQQARKQKAGSIGKWLHHQAPAATTV